MKKKIKIFAFIFIVNILFVGYCSAYTFNCNYDGVNENEGYFFWLKFEVENSKYKIADCYRLNDNRKLEDKNVTLAERPLQIKDGEYNCSSFSFEANNQDTNDPKCPASGALTIDLDTKEITWGENTGTVSDESSIDRSSITSCFGLPESTCESNGKFSCVWVKTGDNQGYCNVNALQYIKCGSAFDIPEQAPRIMSFVINLLKIGTPIILIIVGLVTLVKALAASKEDEIKKAQTSLIKKMIAAALVFFVVAIVQFVILKVADDDESGSISSCLSCFLNNDCETNKYFKDKVGDKYVCHYVNNPTDTFTCDDDAD